MGEAAANSRVAGTGQFETPTDPGGNHWDKTTYLERVKAGSFLIESFELSDMKVHVYGDAAVATGLSIVNKHSKSGYVRFAPGSLAP